MAFGIVLLTLLSCLALGLLAGRRGGNEQLERWAIAGRGFGTTFVFLLMAGEIYSAFTFLGASGFVYARGAPAYYILAYPTVAYTLSYLALPATWRYAKRHGLVTQADYFAHQSGSRAFGLVVVLIGVVASLPYLVLQVKGLGIVIEICSGHALSPPVAMASSGGTIALFVLVSGMRGSAWMSVAKDSLVLAVVVFLGVYLPLHYYGGYGPMFRAIDEAKPDLLTLHDGPFGVVWYDSTVALTALGFFLFPHSFAAVFTAREEGSFRRNAVILPLYQLILLFAFFVGFAAILKVPGLQGEESDLALFSLSLRTFPDWAIGIIGAGGALAAVVPGSVILTSMAALVAAEVERGRGKRGEGSALLAKLLVPVVALAAVCFALYGGKTIVALLLVGYALVTQLLWAFLAGLVAPGRVQAPGLIAGVLAGVGLVALDAVRHVRVTEVLPSLPPGFDQVNVGILALVLNLAVVASATAVAALLGRRGLVSVP